MVTKDDKPASDTTTSKRKKPATTGELKSSAVQTAHDAVNAANERRKEREGSMAASAEVQRKNAADNQAKDEAAKASADGTVPGQPALPDVHPHTPLTRDEINALDTAKQVVAQVDNTNAAPLTAEAKERIAAAEDLPPAPVAMPTPTPGASATNPALARNDADATKTPPFGDGNTARLQG